MPQASDSEILMGGRERRASSRVVSATHRKQQGSKHCVEGLGARQLSDTLYAHPIPGFERGQGLLLRGDDERAVLSPLFKHSVAFGEIVGPRVGQPQLLLQHARLDAILGPQRCAAGPVCAGWRRTSSQHRPPKLQVKRSAIACMC